MAIRDENIAVQDGDGAHKKSKNPRTRQVHRTCSVSKREQSAARQEERYASDEVASVEYERDTLNYGEVMRSTKRAEWQTALQEKIAALESNDV